MELNFHHLRYFQAVAHEGSLTRAAALLHVSQSAVSSQIRLLEERLGQPLFTRAGKALHLTEAGRIALDHADAIFATGRELVATLQQRGRPRQALRVGALATLSRNFQLAFLRPVLGRADVEVILRSGNAGELLAALVALQLDVVLTSQPPPADAASPFLVRRLDEQPVGLIGVPALAAGRLAEGVLAGRPGALEEYLREAILLLPGTASGLRMSIDALFDRLRIVPRIGAEVDDMAMLRLLAREGIGPAVLPPIVVRDELAAGTLVEIARLPGLSETFYGVSVERRFRNPLLEHLYSPRA